MTRDDAKWVIELIRDRYSSVDVDRLSLTDAETDAINMAIRSLEAWGKLYEETAEWEAQALDEVRKHIHDEDAGEWRRWSHILNERTAFKFDVMKHLKEVEDDKRRNTTSI